MFGVLCVVRRLYEDRDSVPQFNTTRHNQKHNSHSDVHRDIIIRNSLYSVFSALPGITLNTQGLFFRKVGYSRCDVTIRDVLDRE
jgi:hypothetical protein